MANFIKKILSGIGILALVLVILVVIADDDTPTQPQQNAGYSDEVDDNNDDDNNGEEDDYYFLELEDGSSKGIMKPQSILNDLYNNMNDQRMESIFRSIYNYDYNHNDVYIVDVPNGEQTLRELLKEPYAVGTVFNFTVELVSGLEGNGLLVGDLLGDTSIDSLVIIDPSYVGEEVYDFVGEEIVSFDAVYAGLDIDSDPTFIALSMDVQ